MDNVQAKNHDETNTKEMLRELFRSPEDVLNGREKRGMTVMEALQYVYEVTSRVEENHQFVPTSPDLVVENMDEDQIWQQIEMRNSIYFEQPYKNTSKITAFNANSLKIYMGTPNTFVTENDYFLPECNTEPAETNSSVKEEKIVDEQKEEFRIQDEQSFEFEPENSSAKACGSKELISGKKEELLAKAIRDYEARIISGKPWSMLGEAHGQKRPKNSLLQELLEFDPMIKPPPIITEKTTNCLDSIIKQRIKDQAWDDVVHITKPLESTEYKKQLVLEHNKSEKSLSQIYEKAYENKLENSGVENLVSNVPKEHAEVEQLLRNLFIKLGSLSNFDLTLRPMVAEAKIISDSSVISRGEVAPIADSNSKFLTPEENYLGPKHQLISKTEFEKRDKRRLTRKTKQKYRASTKHTGSSSQSLRINGVVLHKNKSTKEKSKRAPKNRQIEIINSNQDRTFKQSKTFFAKLQQSSVK